MKIFVSKCCACIVVLFFMVSCTNVSNKLDEKLNLLNTKAEKLDSLINTEFDKVNSLDTLINFEHNKIKKLDSLINQSTSKLDSLANNKLESLKNKIK